MERNTKEHFVLIHGACHGAWCWYKVVPLLKAAGHNVTALDLSACGVNPRRIDEVKSLHDYVQPLVEFMSSLPQDEKIILVGHSYGGISMSQAMERYPEKILVAVYVTACALSYKSTPADVLNESFKQMSAEELSGIKSSFDNDMDNPTTSTILDLNHMETHVYQNCQQEDVELANLLLRPCSLFTEDLNNEYLLTEENFGSVNCAYVICKEDKCLKEDFQRWLTETSPNIKDVKEIEGADHMAMLSKPHELCACLLEIADSFNLAKTS